MCLPQGPLGGERHLGGPFERLDTVDLADQYPASLSGGEKQRVAIGRALATRPAVVLAGEPTWQHDPDTEARVLDMLDEATQETALVVVIDILPPLKGWDSSGGDGRYVAPTEASFPSC